MGWVVSYGLVTWSTVEKPHADTARAAANRQTPYRRQFYSVPVVKVSAVFVSLDLPVEIGVPVGPRGRGDGQQLLHTHARVCVLEVVEPAQRSRPLFHSMVDAMCLAEATCLNGLARGGAAVTGMTEIEADGLGAVQAHVGSARNGKAAAAVAADAKVRVH